MHPEPSAGGDLLGELQAPEGPVTVRVREVAPHTLSLQFPEGLVPANGTEFLSFRLKAPARELLLGRCRFHSHQENPLRRKNDPPPAGDGRIVFLDELYDFSSLGVTGLVFELAKRLEQLPILWGRKKEIRPAFRDYVGELVYDLQVYRGLLDEIDRSLVREPGVIRAEVHRVVSRSEYPAFCRFFDQKLAELEALVAGFTQEEHERHGFYLRKHVWDIINTSEFLLRTNLKPRGYAGDSEMMRMLYENDFRGPTVFSRFIHRHPIETAAAQAVRNRVSLLAARMALLASERGPTSTIRLMSVACGPAWELRELFREPADFGRFDVTLLDQDPDALAEAQAVVAQLDWLHSSRMKVHFIRDSVRTMLRTPDLSAKWGRFGFLYTMGMFDYLTTPVASAVLRRLYDLLEPGGELVVGNFHVGCATRRYLEYWMDWVLLYRTEDELEALAAALPGATVTVVFEETRSQMFLCVRKA